MSKENDKCVYPDIHIKNSMVGFEVWDVSDAGVSADDRCFPDQYIHVAMIHGCVDYCHGKAAVRHTPHSEFRTIMTFVFLHFHSTKILYDVFFICIVMSKVYV